MAQFAELDTTNVVTRVIIVNDSELLDEHGQAQESRGVAFCQSLFGKNTNWVQTEDGLRKNLAGIGYSYDAGRDAFIPSKPINDYSDNLIFDEDTCRWIVPLCISIITDNHVIVGDGIDTANVKITGAVGAVINLDILAGETAYTERIVLDTTEVAGYVGSSLLVISCDTPGVNISISYGNITETLVVVRA